MAKIILQADDGKQIELDFNIILDKDQPFAEEAQERAMAAIEDLPVSDQRSSMLEAMENLAVINWLLGYFFVCECGKTILMSEAVADEEAGFFGCSDCSKLD